ncbi:unnamed protein product [Rhizophagus irregularis]|nr:unnamed protein product [Rhizophagus irregularis]
MSVVLPQHHESGRWTSKLGNHTNPQYAKALEVEQVMAIERDIVKDTYGPSPNASQTKGKEKENPKAVTQENHITPL